MEPSEHLQLPVRLELAPRESGLGFALRALCANGVSFDRGMKWLGLERHRPIDRQTARRIAWALNVDADQWAERVAMRDPGGPGWVRLAGQRFRRQIASNRRYAKLCPQCVREHGVAHVSWLLRATVGCPWHGYSLIWSCQHCGMSIGWDRPDIDICRCGYPFKAVKASPLESGVAAWLCWLESTLCPAAPWAPCGAATERIPSALTHLSIDGAFRVIEAMGLRTGESSSAREALSKCAMPRELGVVIARGLERLHAIEADPENAARYAEGVHHQALVQLAKDYAAEEDYLLAWWLMNAFRSDFDPGGTRAGSRPKGQLPLFLT